MIEPKYLEKTRLEVEKHLKIIKRRTNALSLGIFIDDLEIWNPVRSHVANLTADLQEEQRKIMQYLLSNQ